MRHSQAREGDALRAGKVAGLGQPGRLGVATASGGHVRVPRQVRAVLVFTVLTLAATLRHLDKFHRGGAFAIGTQIVTWAWIAIGYSAECRGKDGGRAEPVNVTAGDVVALPRRRPG